MFESAGFIVIILCVAETHANENKDEKTDVIIADADKLI